MNKRILILVSLIVYYILSFAQQNEPYAKHGVLDLRNWDMSKPIYLKGQWEFYWKKFYTPFDFAEKNLSPDAYIQLPNSWETLNIDGITDTGYATFRLTILFKHDAYKRYSIFINEILSSYQAFINKKLIANNGIPGTCSCNTKPRVRVIYTTIGDIPTDEIEIVFNVANFVHRNAGLITVPVIGEENAVFKYYIFRLFLDLLMLGAIFIMALYHLGLFIIKRDNFPALSFALFLSIVAVRILVTSNYLYFVLMPKLSWATVYRLGYLTFYFLVPAFVFFVQETFKFKKYKWAFRSIYLFSVLYAFTVVLPPLKFTKILFIYQIFTLIAVVFVFYILITNIKNKIFGLRLFLTTYVFFFFTGIHDILYSMGVIHSAFDLTHIGSFVLIFGQSITLARIFTKAFNEKEQLTIELNYQKEHLEDIVKERTKELAEKNEELTEQKELLEIRNQIIQESIAYASTIQKAVLPLREHIYKYFDNFILYLPRDIVSGDFYWFNDYNKRYVFLAISDCTGHGVPAAFLSLIGSYLLYSLVVEKNMIQPSEIIRELDKIFHKFFKKKGQRHIDGMDIILCRFDKQDIFKMTYASANMDFIVANVKKKATVRYKGSRFIVGMRSNAEITDIDYKIDKDDVLYFYSDGYKDQNNEQRQRYGSTKLVNFIKSIVHLPMEEQKNKLLIEIEQYRGSAPQRDDILVMGIKPKQQLLNL